MHVLSHFDNRPKVHHFGAKSTCVTFSIAGNIYIYLWVYGYVQDMEKARKCRNTSLASLRVRHKTRWSYKQPVIATCDAWFASTYACMPYKLARQIIALPAHYPTLAIDCLHIQLFVYLSVCRDSVMVRPCVKRRCMWRACGIYMCVQSLPRATRHIYIKRHN